MLLQKQLEKVRAEDEFEAAERSSFLQFLTICGDKALLRETLPGHLSASAWVLNRKRDKVLMIYHNLFHSWTWPGGHADGEENLAAVARREVEEETGLKAFYLLEELPIDLNVLPVFAHLKHGRFVPSHLHFNAVYLFEADETEALHPKPDENSAVRWIDVCQIKDCCTERHIMPYYERIMRKVKERGLHNV